MTILIQFASLNPGTFFLAFTTTDIPVLLVLLETYLKKKKFSLTNFSQPSLGFNLRLSVCLFELVSSICSKNLTLERTTHLPQLSLLISG